MLNHIFITIKSFLSHSITRNVFVVLIIGISGLIFVVAPGLNMGQTMPGDIGDSSFNNFVLEHFFRWITGRVDSFWNAEIFYPFPLTIAFSDNLLGSAPIYSLFRLFGLDRESAFQMWFVTGYLLNYIAAAYILQRLNLTALSAGFGAFIFTFSLPIVVHEVHAQLLYRFATPFAILNLLQFYDTGQLRKFSLAAIWTIAQFYLAIYTGFFLSLLMFLTTIVALLLKNHDRPFISQIIMPFRKSFTEASTRDRKVFVMQTFVAILFFLLLIWPYLETSRLYKFKRGWSEISSMLPRVQSYFLADSSAIWKYFSSSFQNIPMRHEHQLFLGAIPFLCLVTWLTLHKNKQFGFFSQVLGYATGYLVVFTLFISGFSLYAIILWVPGFSSIRAVTRIIVILLFPISYLCAISLDAFSKYPFKHVLLKILPLLIVMLGIFEASSIQHYVSLKEVWKNRNKSVESALPSVLPEDPILFVVNRAGDTSPSYAVELDGMILAQKFGWKTLNGYSGNAPPGYSSPNSCNEAYRRILSYLDFFGVKQESEYLKYAQRVVQVGRNDCDLTWQIRMPCLTKFGGPIPTEIFQNIGINIDGMSKVKETDSSIEVSVSLSNINNESIHAISATNQPVRLSWRFLDAESRTPLSGWDSRMDISFDIPANGILKEHFIVLSPKTPGMYRISFSVVQESVRWLHDIGFNPPFSRQTVSVDTHGFVSIGE